MAENQPRVIDSISELIKEVSPYYAKEGDPQEHILTYESYAETLEPIYYFILDLMDDFGLKPEKLIDNFSPSPGSADFGELGTRASVMQQQASKMLVDINAVLKSVLNILYDLKDFRNRLQSYDDFHSDDENIKKSARLSLKQIWMDKVDISRGNSSIKGMAAQGGFTTLIHAFLAIDSVKDAEALDLAEPVKRILFPRVQEFNNWLTLSEKELRSRYKIEKNYLKSQVNSLKLYSRWAKPYLLAAQELERKITKNAALVSSFNRTILQLTLLGKNKLNVEKEAIAGEFPADFRRKSFRKKLKRDYSSCVLIDFVFRAVPQGTKAGGSAYIGRVDIKFRGYSLNEEELAKLDQEMKKSDMGDALRLIEGITDDSLKQIQDDINFFLEEEPEEKKQEKTSSEGGNPFLALIGYYNKPKEKKETSKESKKGSKEKDVIVKPETYLEKNFLRKHTVENSKEIAFKLFDIYKKSHGMASYT